MPQAFEQVAGAESWLAFSMPPPASPETANGPVRHVLGRLRICLYFDPVARRAAVTLRANSNAPSPMSPSSLPQDLDVDAERNNAAVRGEVHSVDHDDHEIERREIRSHEVAQGGLGHDDKTPGDGGLGRALRSRLDGRADGLETDCVATGGKLGEHLGHGLAAEKLGRRRSLIGRQLHLGAPIRTAKPRAGDGHLPAAQGHEPDIGSVAHCGPLGVVAAPGAGERGRLVFEDHVEHLQARADGKGERALLEVACAMSHRESS